MANKSKKIMASALSLLLAMSLMTFNVSAGGLGNLPGDPPDGNGPGGPGGLGEIPPGGGSSTSVSYTGATEISSDTTKSDACYTSSTSGENALLVSGGTSTLTNFTVTKSGDESDENSDFYGTNAAVLVYNDATLTIKGGTVTTNGAHANGVFAYGTGTVNISDTTINTRSNNSGGIMVTGGGTLNATNLTVETQGNSSASIRSDRAGGTITVDGGSYTTNGQGSPSIYSTAEITVNNAALTATSSEGVVVEGANSVTLNNCVLTDTNNTLNGQSETYKNIFLYQSMSGDASEGTSYFNAKNCTITTNKGDTFYITNTSSEITLTNNAIVNNDSTGVLLRAEAAAWGSSGSNGGKVVFNLSNQTAEGDIVIDSVSALSMELSDSSTYKGAINNANQGGTVSLSLDDSSVVVLTGDSYLSNLSNSVSDNSNIYLNGYKLYVNGTAVSANDGTAPEVTTDSNAGANGVTTSTSSSTSSDSNDYTMIIVIAAIVLLAAGAGCAFFFVNKSKKEKAVAK